MYGKYMNLNSQLQILGGQGKKTWKTTFSQMERLIGVSLPPSAFCYREWWANDTTHVQARAWMDDGWRTRNVDMEEKTLEFYHQSEGMTVTYLTS